MLQPGAKKLLQPTARSSISTSRIALHNHNQHKAQPKPASKPVFQPKPQRPQLVQMQKRQQQQRNDKQPQKKQQQLKERSHKQSQSTI
jgi:hypothetical protein